MNSDQEGLDVKNFLCENKPYPHLPDGAQTELMTIAVTSTGNGRPPAERVRSLKQASVKAIVRDKIAFPLICDVVRFNCATVEASFAYKFLAHKSGSVSVNSTLALPTLIFYHTRLPSRRAFGPP